MEPLLNIGNNLCRHLPILSQQKIKYDKNTFDEIAKAQSRNIYFEEVYGNQLNIYSNDDSSGFTRSPDFN